ncbi:MULTISPECIES: SRPBCC domain-containing protein [Oceanobacillus]|uniref:Activator of Hsp90 ATPase homologue 1/2-like C-terminal domain-containing protein n=1 Tax=Oceanobacillus kimchii TaxID=746691 RepID=A0ABQ5TG39_9BACI|nr:MULTISPECIES: SRPBCC domain-containing protein [Oceanobacillus]MBT2600575.1 SRPBCC domain-containing protein [Oceanobacillus sp. ISL-74]MBT2651028.1 SRPBCC domain-containing protein [Oceanobacillus sp. ISL-73]MCT1578915.1 SRPBCC domain-containing protein [Oceanobacillus kimchii]MCT2137840.1 SRPBCC domain-containing protein [Oceanobacillus kimchii]OEH53383.1 hypothetical protein AQ616_16925 [Oceanobacillus sp. E9]
MENTLVVQESIRINTTATNVWEILTNPRYVAIWDELPEDYPQEHMTTGSKVIWDTPNGNQSITTIIKALKEEELVIDLYVTSWKKKPQQGEVAYRFYIEENNDHTLLSIEIGDFSLIENGQMYYDASVEFAEDAKQTIKDLAEGL